MFGDAQERPDTQVNHSQLDPRESGVFVVSLDFLIIAGKLYIQNIYPSYSEKMLDLIFVKNILQVDL